MAEVKWIKITTDIFNDEKIQLIESMPDSDTIIVIWFKLLSLAGKSNNGGLVMISDKVPYTNDMLATLFRRKKSTVELALLTFEQFGMIERLDNDAILISNWDKHQNIDGMEKIKIQNRERQRRFRESKTLLLDTKKKEKDKENKIKNKNKRKSVTNTLHNVTNNVTDIIAYLNNKLGTKYKATSAKNQSLIKARINEGYDINDFKTVIDKKYNEWNNTDMAKYLQPTTLFGNKFEGYLNQLDTKPNRQSIADIKDEYRTHIPDKYLTEGPF